MTTKAIEIQGTLREDGTLVLDEKPNLPPGRVKVTLQPATTGESEFNDVVSVLARIHAAQARGEHTPRSAEEIEAYLAEMRDDDERSHVLERIQDECRRHRERQPPEVG